MLRTATGRRFLRFFRNAKDVTFAEDPHLQEFDWKDYATKISRLNEFSYDTIQFDMVWKRRDNEYLPNPILMLAPDIWGNIFEIKLVFNLNHSFIEEYNENPGELPQCKILLRKNNPDETRLLGFLKYIKRVYDEWTRHFGGRGRDIFEMDDNGNTIVDFRITYISHVVGQIRSKSYADIHLMVDGGYTFEKGLVGTKVVMH